MDIYGTQSPIRMWGWELCYGFLGISSVVTADELWRSLATRGFSRNIAVDNGHW